MSASCVVEFLVSDGRCRTREFLDSLSVDCKTAARFLIEQLMDSGIGLAGTRYSKPLSGAGSGLWELRKHCDKKALRLYYWRSGHTEFTVAWGELKDSDTASKTVIDYVVASHQEWKDTRDQLRRRR